MHFCLCFKDSDHSTYTWRASDSNHNDPNSYKIDGDRLVIYESAGQHGQTFACQLGTDSEFGPISIELDVNQELIERALNQQQPESDEAPARLYIDEHRDSHNSYLECQPGEDC